MKMMLGILIIICLLFSKAEGQIFSLKEYKKAAALFSEGEYDSSHPIFLRLIKQEVSDSIRAECFLRLGHTAKYKNQIDSAISFFKEAVALFLMQNNKVKAGRAYEGIAQQYQLKKNYEEMKQYNELALNNYNSATDSVQVYLSGLISFLEENKFDSAYFFTKTVLNKYPDTLVTYQQFYINETKGLYFASRKQIDSAVIFLNAALLHAPDERYKAFIYDDLADSYRLNKNFKKALLYMDSALQHREATGWTENIQFSYETYQKIYADLGDYKKAYLYSDSSKKLTDSLFNTDATRARLDAEAKYKNQQVLIEKATVEKQNSITQRNLIVALSGLGFIALLAFLSLRISRVRKKANTKLSAQKEEVQQLADQLSAANETKARLFSTIGHDLRSPVSSLYALLKMQEIKGGSQSNEMSGHTVQLMDTLEDLLVWSKSQMEGFVLQPVKMNVKDLLEELRQFYDAAAQAKEVSLINNAQRLSVRTDENILKTILRNAISNAIAHTGKGNAILFSAEPGSDGKVVISINNPCSKQDFDQFNSSFENAAIKSSTHGFGIVLMKEFAQKINAQVVLSYEAGHAVLKIFV